MRKSIPGAGWRILSLDEALASLEDGTQLHPSLDDFARFMLKCRTAKDRASAQRLHSCLRKIGLEEHALLGNHLVVMLVEVGSMHDAQQVFDGLAHRNERSWNSLIIGYNKCGKPHLALAMYEKMLKDAFSHPNGHTFVAILKACGKLKDLEMGVETHDRVARMGFLDKDPFVGSSLVDMYIKC
eukprot:c16361_g3_i4 orf=678-1229(+)